MAGKPRLCSVERQLPRRPPVSARASPTPAISSGAARSARIRWTRCRWAVEQRIADPARVAVLGGSFGGYSVLAGLTFTPESFACGVDLVGPSNLITLLESSAPLLEADARAVHHPRGISARRKAAALLEGSLAADPRAPHLPSPVDRAGRERPSASSRPSLTRSCRRGRSAGAQPVPYVLYPDEGHGFGAALETNISFNAVAEAFLAKCLGGRAEPVGDAFTGASIQASAGMEDVPGLAEAVAAKKGYNLPCGGCGAAGRADARAGMVRSHCKPVP